ncbi:lysosomal acid glucosylceramidase-like [Chrysoperla carnea]|uniref:lysosomal acid glucosylceramidase-like n=1 Tax=Chrysoperla carnea TaxID=189513 RepID=UPI001D083B3A|nr:lysosomal acid glucosylceramidase-like [Chrysoperla carnea]
MKKDFGKMLTFQNRKIIDITLSREKKYQTIIGFGGAMTDSSGINIASLTDAAQDLLMQQYFGDRGIQYTIIRVPIGGTDFSTHSYSLDDTPYDIQLKDFKLSEEDKKYKIPYIRLAMRLSKTYPIHLMGCSWSAPAYMKSNQLLRGVGTLGRAYYQTYANYLTKFLQEYKKQGFNFVTMSAQNEPIIGGTPLTTYNGMEWNAWTQTDFVLNYLRPTLSENGFENVKIIIGDDQRVFMPNWLLEMLTYKPEISKYIDGIGIHWYLDSISDPNELTKIHKTPGFENKFIIYTEASVNSLCGKRGVTLGEWENGEDYLKSLIDTLNNWNQGWIDWNLVLDLNGGPNWVNNVVSAPIIVNASANEFYKNPTFYALGHVSKFIVPGSIRIDMVNGHDKIVATAFDTPDNRTVIVLLNLYGRQYNIFIQDIERSWFQSLAILPHSFMTVIY